MKWFWFSLAFVFVAPVSAKEKISVGDLLPLVISNDQIGMWMSEGVEKQNGGLTNDPKNLARVHKVSQRLLTANHLKTKYDFGILASNDFQAVSIYGARIRVFQGLLSDTRNSDAELAAVLAHEIAHNECGHNKKAVKTFKIAYALELSGLTAKSPKLLLAAAQAALAKRSRKFEKQADKQALVWMVQAGYPITGAIAVFRRIEAEHDLSQMKSSNDKLAHRFDAIFATHPEPKDRVEMAEDYLLEKKYGRTFKMVKGIEAIPIADSFSQPTDTFVPSPASQFGSEWLEKCSEGVWKLHCGVDVDIRQSGKEVRAAGNGIVRYAGSFDKKGIWGNCVILEHQTPDLGVITTLYGHIKIASGVNEDSLPKKDDLLGTIDPAISPPHLHFGIRVNPYDDLAIRGALFNCANPDHQPKFPERWIDPIQFLKNHEKSVHLPDHALIIKGPFHLGDDVEKAEMHRDATFDFQGTDAILRLRIKGTPRKDPIIWINRQEIGRITTTDDKWHTYDFVVPKSHLFAGKNLFHIQSYIPDRWQTFDDCEVADVWLHKQ